MARLKSSEDAIRTLTLVGQKSLSVTIPKRIIERLRLLPNQKVLVRREGSKITIELLED